MNDDSWRPRQTLGAASQEDRNIEDLPFITVPMLGVRALKATSPFFRSGNSGSALNAGSSCSKRASGGHLNSGQQGRYSGYCLHRVNSPSKSVVEGKTHFSELVLRSDSIAVLLIAIHSFWYLCPKAQERLACLPVFDHDLWDMTFPFTRGKPCTCRVSITVRIPHWLVLASVLVRYDVLRTCMRSRMIGGGAL